jgi:hypothetical protein
MLSKYLKNIGLKRHQIIGLPGAPTRLGQDLTAQLCPEVNTDLRGMGREYTNFKDVFSTPHVIIIASNGEIFENEKLGRKWP